MTYACFSLHTDNLVRKSIHNSSFLCKKLWKVSENGIDQSQTSVVHWSIAAFPIVRQIETDLQMFNLLESDLFCFWTVDQSPTSILLVDQSSTSILLVDQSPTKNISGYNC